MSKITEFAIQGLHGYRNITIPIRDNKIVLVGVKGDSELNKNENTRRIKSRSNKILFNRFNHPIRVFYIFKTI